MKIEDVQKCSFQNWYYDFERITIKSLILPLPAGFAEYILKDGIVLPKSSDTYEVDQINSDDSDSETDWNDSNSCEAEAPHFHEFDSQVKSAIECLGGKVFPKLNWSSPRDACWIAYNSSCCCDTVSDIYLLLKSSDFIIHDLENAFRDCEDYIPEENSVQSLSQPSEEFCLILRRWMEIDPSCEFRCFVKNNNLIGISQREASLYFDHIGKNKNNIIEDILKFFRENIQFKFPSTNYVFDVYRKKEKRVQLLDFNPFGKVTDSLLFDWEELEKYTEIQDGVPEFRYVSVNLGVQPCSLSYYAYPKDIIDVGTCEDTSKLVDLINMKTEDLRGGFSSDEECENDYCEAEK